MMVPEKYEIFYPNIYSPEEQVAIDRLLSGKQGPPGGPGGPGGPPMMKEQVYQKEKLNEVVMRMYAERIIPDNPLYNDPDYAKNTWYSGLPIVPGYVEALAMAMLPRELGDMCMPDRQMPGDAYDHEVQYFAPILAGDKLTNKPGPVELIDITPAEGSIIRCFVVIAQADIINQRGETVGRSITRFPNFRCRLKPGQEPDPFVHPFNRYMHPAHQYTDADYDYLKSIWQQEKIRGAEPLYWDDVNVGDYTGITAEPPFTQMDMIRMYGQELIGCESVRGQVLSGRIRGQKNEYGVYENIISHYKPGRSPFYNYSGRDFCVRNVTNWAGDQGFITRLNWRMVNDFEPELQAQPFPEGFYRESYLLKVPELKAKGAHINTHGMAPDCAITHGYVYDKYERDGQYYVELACWCEDLDGNYHTECGVTVRLPKRT